MSPEQKERHGVYANVLEATAVAMEAHPPNTVGRVALKDFLDALLHTTGEDAAFPAGAARLLKAMVSE